MVADGTRASNSRRTSSASGAAPDAIQVSSDRSAFSSGWPSSIAIIDGTNAPNFTRYSSASFSQPPSEGPDALDVPVEERRGVDGDTTAGVLKRMDSIVSAKARKAFVMIGLNDFKEGRSVDAVLQDYRSIVSRLSESGMKVYVESTLACNEAKAEWIGCASIQGKIRQLNRGLAGLASANVTFIDINAELAGANGLKPDLTYDGVHLNGEGYKVWRDRISKFVMTD